jgi:phospholipase A-2-activating protein
LSLLKLWRRISYFANLTNYFYYNSCIYIKILIQKVCTLYFNQYDNLLYSGSFDATTKVWNLNNLVKSNFKLSSSFTLAGHALTVWCVLGVDKQGVMLTASADKTIRHWQLSADKRSADGLCKYVGHTDCVRGLALNTNNKQEFFSCSNDGGVLHWRLGQPAPLRTVHVTDSFLYSINMLNYEQNESLRNNIEECYFVTSGEDRSVRVHHSSSKTGIATVQTLSLPCQTVWSAVCLPNGDVAAACSDGSIRVFTQNESQFATPGEIEEYERELGQFAIPVKSDSALSQMNRNDLPGIEALELPGKMEGQPLMINNNNEVEVYQWESSESRWVKIGVAVGSSEAGAGATAKKVTYLGKEYDYVFDIELDDTGAQKLKLPYNLAENPYLTAQEFIHKHELSQYFLDQIAQFIIKNTNSETIGYGSQASSAYDPFTGGNRYVPGGAPPATYSNGSSRANVVGGGADPFTGSNAYNSGSNGAKASVPDVVMTTAAAAATGSNEFYPHLSFINFDAKNLEAIFKKLRELQTQISVDVKSDLISDKSNIELLEHLMNNYEQAQAANELNDQIDLLFQMIDVWPKGKYDF